MRLLIALAVGVAVAAPEWPATSEPYRQAQAAPSQRQAPRNPQLDAEDQLSPGQIERAQEPDRPRPAPRPAQAAAPKRAAPPATVVTCSGVFGKDSNHDNLATAFKLENVDLSVVASTEGRRVTTSVLFSHDPKLRLEVWWRDQGAHSGTYLIDIAGQSIWTAPKGVRLGMELPALEKLNGKPFKFRGFDKDGVGTASDWDGGAFEQLPGGCRLRVFFRPDPKASATARGALSSDKEFVSSDAVIRAIKPTVSEILIGY